MLVDNWVPLAFILTVGSTLRRIVLVEWFAPLLSSKSSDFEIRVNREVD